MIGAAMVVIVGILFLFLYAILGYKKPAIALITLLPIAVLTLFYVGFAIHTTEVLLVAFVFLVLVFLATLVAILIAPHEPDAEQWPRVWAKWLLIGFMLLLLVVTSLAVFGPAGIYGLVLFAFIIGLLVSYGLTSRHATAAYVLSTIGSSMRQNLPLPMALESAASGQTDKRAKILRRVKKWLVQGYSLSESIRRGYPKCPGYAVAMIAAAERIDQLPLAIGAIEADMVAKADESRKVRPVHPLYPVILLSFLFLVVLGLMTYVIPKFRTIMDEMFEGESLPVVTRVVLGISSYVAYEMGPFLSIVLALLFFVVFPVWIRARFRPRRPGKPYLLSRIGDFLKWHLPVLHWFENNYSLVQVVELLRLSLNAGCSVNDAIANTLNLDMNNCFRKRLRLWLARVEAGENIAAAAREAKLGSSLAWAFDEKVNKGNTLSILETLESFYRSNYSYRVNLVRFIMWPCVTIIMGVLVGFVVYSMFSPMITIINHLANLVTP